MFITLDGTRKSSLTSLGLLFLRLGMAGSLMLAHGMGKLSGFSEMAAQFPDPLHVGSTLSLALAVFAEFFCSLLLVLGLFTRFAALVVFINMATAFLVIHGSDPYKVKELAFGYLIAAATLLFTGAGAFSVDGRMEKISAGKPRT